jgi:hypothetical protein
MRIREKLAVAPTPNSKNDPAAMTQIMLAELCRPTVVLPRPIQIGKPGKKAVREKPGRSPERIGGLRRHRCGFRLQG